MTLLNNLVFAEASSSIASITSISAYERWPKRTKDTVAKSKEQREIKYERLFFNEKCLLDQKYKSKAICGPIEKIKNWLNKIFSKVFKSGKFNSGVVQRLPN